jgi:hypothetical protein
MLCSIRPCGGYGSKKAATRATSSGTSFCNHPLFVQFCGHVHAVVGVAGAGGNFVLIAVLLRLCYAIISSNQLD